LFLPLERRAERVEHLEGGVDDLGADAVAAQQGIGHGQARLGCHARTFMRCEVEACDARTVDPARDLASSIPDGFAQAAALQAACVIFDAGYNHTCKFIQVSPDD